MAEPEKPVDSKKVIKDIDDLLAGLAKGSTHIISNPKTIKKAKDSGLPIQESTMTQDEYINSLFEERKKYAAKTIDSFPKPPQISIPPINSLYDEIRECILFGLNGAAITLSSILVEFALKHAIIDKTSSSVYNKDEWDRLEDKELGPVIKEAFERKVINEDERKELIKFKNEIRNPYLHYNIKKLTTGAIMEKATKYDIHTGKVTVERNLKAEDNPVMWQMAKKERDKVDVMNIFSFADSLVKALFKN